MSAKDKKFKAAVIGAGRIGAQFDDPESKKILTHAHAYRANPEVELVGFFDANPEAAKAAAQKWGGSVFGSLEDLMKEKPDLVSICTPDSTHTFYLKELLKYKPGIVICEKPITDNPVEAEEIVAEYKKANLPVLVNYKYRYDSALNKVRQAIENGEFGKVISASAIYTNGLCHNGSHLIDLARFLFGELKNFKIEYALADYGENDKTVAVFLEFEECPQFHLRVGDGRKFTIFELDIIFEKKRFYFQDEFYLTEQEVVDDPDYSGFKCLSRPVQSQTGAENSIDQMVQNALNHLEKGEVLASDLANAVLTQKICNSILSQKNV